MTTPTARITAIINKFRADLLAHEAQAEQALNSAHAHTLAQIQPALNRLYDQIAQKMASGETIPASWVYERLRLENIQLLIQGHIDQYSAIALQQTRMQQHLGAQLGLQSGMEQLHATVPSGVNYSFGVPSVKAINDLVGATQAGSPLADLFNQWGKVAVDDVGKALVTGVTLGNNPRLVARTIQKILRDKTDIALDDSRQRALVIARNEMLRAYRSANLETYRANDDVVDMWIWSAALSPRTCAACIAMNGTKHPLSEEFGSHPCCRCAPVPLTKSWDDILGPLGISGGGISDTRVAIQSGPDWFNEQPEETKQKILGAAKYAAYNNGDFELSGIVGHSHSDDWGHSIYERPLKELVKK